MLTGARTTVRSPSIPGYSARAGPATACTSSAIDKRAVDSPPMYRGNTASSTDGNHGNLGTTSSGGAHVYVYRAAATVQHARLSPASARHSLSPPPQPLRSNQKIDRQHRRNHDLSHPKASPIQEASNYPTSIHRTMEDGAEPQNIYTMMPSRPSHRQYIIHMDRSAESRDQARPHADNNASELAGHDDHVRPLPWAGTPRETTDITARQRHLASHASPASPPARAPATLMSEYFAAPARDDLAQMVCVLKVSSDPGIYLVNQARCPINSSPSTTSSLAAPWLGANFFF